MTLAAGAAAVLLTTVAALATRQVAAGIMAVLLLLVLSQFGSLTTSVADGVLDVRLGKGPLRRRILLSEIASVEVVRNHWIWGWGIRWTPHGWLWNVSGTRGVELVYRNGKRFRIGSDEPEAIAAAIRPWLRSS